MIWLAIRLSFFELSFWVLFDTFQGLFLEMAWIVFDSENDSA